MLLYAEGVMIDRALGFCSAELFGCAVSGRVLDARGAYALYLVGAIGAAVGWLIMKVMVKDRREERRGIA